MLQKLLFLFLTRWWNFSVPIRLRRKGIVVGNDAVFYGMPIVSKAKNSKITIGNRAVLISRSEFTALGVSRPCILRTLNENASIHIGNDVGISGGTICAAESVEIGNDCLIGADAIVVDTDFHSMNPANRRYNNNTESVRVAKVIIRDNVFIGARAIILKGVEIGKNSIVGAGGVVASNVSENVIVGGNPAKELSKIEN